MEKKHNHHHQYIAFGSTPSKPKYTTRHLAALDFLLNINMSKEEEIRKVGMQNAIKMQQMEEREQHHNDEGSIDENTPGLQNLTSILSPEEISASQNELAGKKLLGPHAATGRYPLTFRYHMQRLTDQSALCRQWEDKMIKSTVAIPSANAVAVPTSSGVLKNQQDPTIFASRVFYSRSRSYPIMVASFIKYDAGEEKAKLEKMKADDQKGMEVFELPERDWRGFSYKPYFKQLSEERAGDFYFEKGLLYDPNSLDDPDLRYGCHRYVLQRSKTTGPILSSIITYVNKKDLKETLNEQFREKHPQLPPSLTLSKIRNIKKDMVVFGVQIGLELSTLALAMINFERLCLKGLVTKYNRRLSMAVSLILAFKFHEDGFDATKKKKELLMDFFDKEWDLPPGDIYEAEFGALVHLGFLLHVPYKHLHVVYTRLLNLLNRTSIQYLGEDMLDTYHSDVKQYEMDLERIHMEAQRVAAEAEAAAAAAEAADAEAEAAAAALAELKLEESSNIRKQGINGAHDGSVALEGESVEVTGGAEGDEREAVDGKTCDANEEEGGSDGAVGIAGSKKRRPTKILSSLGMLYKQPSKIFRSTGASSSTISTPARPSINNNNNINGSHSATNGSGATPSQTSADSTPTPGPLSLLDPATITLSADTDSGVRTSNCSLIEQSIDGESLSLGVLSSSGGVSPSASLNSPVPTHPFPLSLMISTVLSTKASSVTIAKENHSAYSLVDSETFSGATEPPLNFVPQDEDHDDNDEESLLKNELTNIQSESSQPAASTSHAHNNSNHHHHHHHHHHPKHHHHHHHHHRRHSSGGSAAATGGSSGHHQHHRHHHNSNTGSSHSAKEVSFAPDLILETPMEASDPTEDDASSSNRSGSISPSMPAKAQQSSGGIVSSLFFRRRSYSNANKATNNAVPSNMEEGSESPVLTREQSPTLGISRTPSPSVTINNTNTSSNSNRASMLLPAAVTSFLMRTTSVDDVPGKSSG